MRWDQPLTRAQIERYERVAEKAERERVARRERLEYVIADLTALEESRSYKKPASLKTGDVIKKPPKPYKFTDA